MPWTARENFLRNASFQGHQWIPSLIAISQAYWREAREEAEEVCIRHPRSFPGFQRGKIDFDAGFHGAGQIQTRTDEWGCTWQHELDGLQGIVVRSPLEDWAALDSWKPPEPPAFTEQHRKSLEEMRARGQLTSCHLDHGFFFMRLYYLRGFENFMIDAAMEDSRLDRLGSMVEDYWWRFAKPWIDSGIDQLAAADDLGTQTASMLGPKLFRRWLMPAYQRLFFHARKSGAHVAMHHDGYIMDILEEIIESGVTIINPQDLVNGIDNLAREAKGRVCIRLDLDRQKVVPFGSPGDVRDLVREAVMKLGSAQGGLELIVGIYPPTPIDNLEALVGAFEEYQEYWVNR